MCDKRKPWEETWTATGGNVHGPRSVEDWNEGWAETIADCHGSRHATENATLCAAAPDLVRALLAVEWDGPGEAACPRCLQLADDGHATDCPRQAALRKAGVIE